MSVSNGRPSPDGQVPPVLVALRRVKPLPAFLIALAVVLAGLLLPGVVGACVLLLLVAALAVLMTRTWPVTSPGTRFGRLLVLAVLLAFAIAKIS